MYISRSDPIFLYFHFTPYTLYFPENFCINEIFATENWSGGKKKHSFEQIKIRSYLFN